MKEDQRKVIRYCEETSRRTLCVATGYDYDTICGATTYFRLCTPRSFMKILSRHVPVDIWAELIRDIPKELEITARYRCLQIVAEYASVDFGADFLLFFTCIPNVVEMRAALAFFYECCEDRTCQWFGSACAFDDRLFSQTVYRIISGCLSPLTGSYFKRALVYAWQVIHAPRRIYLDTGQPVCVLRRVRRAYEHVMAGRISVHNFLHVHRLLCDPVRHSQFLYAVVNDANALVIRCNEPEEPHLILTGDTRKHFTYHHYRGALEMLSACSDDLQTVYMDGRFDHHRLLREESSHFVFDVLPCSLVGPRPRAPPMERSVVAAITNRVVDLLRPVTYYYEDTATTNTEECEKERLFHASTDVDCEKNRLSVIRYTQDFLLWIVTRQ
jgi:hypothetical protein